MDYLNIHLQKPSKRLPSPRLAAVLTAALLLSTSAAADSAEPAPTVGSLTTCDVTLTETIKVGILHSLSGTMAISETTLKDTMLMLIDEQNAKGGLLGEQIVPVVVDPASDWPLFAEKARELIEIEVRWPDGTIRRGRGRAGERVSVARP